MQLKADVSKCFKPHFYISAIKASFLYAVKGYNIVVASAHAATKGRCDISMDSEYGPLHFCNPKTRAMAKCNPLNVAPAAGQQSCCCFAQARPKHQQEQIVFKHPAGLYLNIPGLISIDEGRKGFPEWKVRNNKSES